MNNPAAQWLTRTRAQLCNDFTELGQQYSAPGKIRPILVDPERTFADLRRGRQDMQR